MRIALVSSEVVGFAKTGGLADVAGALPPALETLGEEVVVFLPMYHCIRKTGNFESTKVRFQIPLGPKLVPGSLAKSKIPGSNVTIYLVENPDLFERDNPAYGRGFYQFAGSEGAKKDYPDNSARFYFFNQAVLASFPQLGFWPDVVHWNDWQSGIGPVLLREKYDKSEDRSLAEKYQKVRSLMTIHNIAYQGNFWKEDMNMAHLNWSLFNLNQLEFHDNLSFLKAGIVFSDRISTVSPTYAREIQTPYYGYGLQGVLTVLASKLTGIVNGIDYKVWDPANDPLIAGKFDARNIQPGKALCKKALQHELGLEVNPAIPIVGLVARLVQQKGIDLVIESAWRMMDLGIQLVVLGEGDSYYQNALVQLQATYPGRVALNFAFSESMAHKIEAGSDCFLMPSLYEPSGLNQLYSMRYGTLPIVRATGGLADTVTDANAETLFNNSATGFSFNAYSSAALYDCLFRAIDCYRNHPQDWAKIQRNAMTQDWSWNRSAKNYQQLYGTIISSRA